MDLADDDGGALIGGSKRPVRKPSRPGRAAGAGGEPDPPHRQENEPSHQDRQAGRDVVPDLNPVVEAGRISGHKIEAGVFPERRERPVDETPAGVAGARREKDRMPPLHGAFLRRVIAAPVGLSLSLPAGIFEMGATPRRMLRVRLHRTPARSILGTKMWGSLPSSPPCPKWTRGLREYGINKAE